MNAHDPRPEATSPMNTEGTLLPVVDAAIERLIASTPLRRPSAVLRRIFSRAR